MRTCFFIRPFTAARTGNEDPATFEATCRAVQTAATQAGVRLIDPAADQRAGTIIDHVRTAIDDADAIVALVTGENPNVFYELGWARREALLLVCSATTIPFDIRGYRYWEYGGLSESTLAARLYEALDQTLASAPASRPDRLKTQIEHFFMTPLPTVAEANGFDLLGVWRSPEVSPGLPDPPYVPRDRDVALERAIAKAKIIVVTGDVKAGKSRSAAHALRAVAGSSTLLVPRPGLSQSLPAFTRLAVTTAVEAQEQSFILWLDDLDKYLRASLLEYQDIKGLLSCQALSVVATIRTPSLHTLQTADHDFAKAAQMLLARAEIIEVPGVLSKSEREVAQSLYPHLPLGPSLGESFVAAPQLRARLDVVDDDAVASVALARAAIDVQRLGVADSIDLDALRTLHRAYVVHLGPQTIYEPAGFEPSVRAALVPVARHSALLVRDPSDWREDRFRAPDFLVEHIERRGDAVLPVAWSWAIDHLASGSAAYLLGDEANRRSQFEWAQQAWRRGAAFDHGLSVFKLGLAVQQDDPQAAEEYLRRAAQLGIRRANLALADLFRRTNRLGDAIEVLETEFEGGSLRAAYLLCAFYYASDQRSADYERVCRRAIELGSAWHAHELGNRFRQQGALEEAIAILDQGLDLCVINQDRLFREADDGNIDRITLADDALGVVEEDHYRTNLNTVLRLGQSLESAGAITGAERAYRFLHAQGSLGGSLRLAALLINSERTDEARLLARELASSSSIVERLSRGELVPAPAREVFGLTFLTLPSGNPDFVPELLADAGDIFCRLGQPNLAAVLWQAGTDRGSAACAWKLAQLLKDEGDPAKFESALRIATKLGSARAAGTLAIMLRERGATAEAERLFRSVCASSEAEIVANARFHLGVLFQRQRRVQEAETEYRWIMENADDATAAQAAANLGLMLGQFPERYLDAAQAFIEGIDRGNPDCANLCRQSLTGLYTVLFPRLVKEDGERLLLWAIKLNQRQIATPHVLAGIVLGTALTGQLDAGREVLSGLRKVDADRLKEIERILACEVTADSAAGRALQSMRAEHESVKIQGQ